MKKVWAVISTNGQDLEFGSSVSLFEDRGDAVKHAKELFASTKSYYEGEERYAKEEEERVGDACNPYEAYLEGITQIVIEHLEVKGE